jgi:osmoprotectant transport system permease protein
MISSLSLILIAAGSSVAFAQPAGTTPPAATPATTAAAADASLWTVAADNLLLLTDPRAALPAYDALLLVGPRRPDLAAKLAGLEGRIPVDAMREANWQVDRDTDKRTVGQAAKWLAGRIAVPR